MTGDGEFDLAVVGAGIVGAAIAAEASRRGLRTLVLERRSIGSGSTAAGMGHIVVMDDSEAQFALTSYSRRLWNNIAASLPGEVALDPSGTIWVAADAEEMAAVEQKYHFYRQRDVRCEILDAAELKRHEPNLRDGMVGGLRVPDDSVLYPPCAAAHLLALARKHGAVVREQVSVSSLNDDGTVDFADGSLIQAANCVNATGCWAPELSPNAQVRKRKGHLVITDRYPGYARHQIIELGYLKSAHGFSKDSVAFNIQPRKNGQMLIGSSRQFDAEDTQVELEILGRMLRRACQYMPSINRLQAIRVWTGDRPATPDKLPLIGPQLPNSHCWLAAGHEGLGITTSLATARLLVDQLLGVKTEIPAEPYAPSRAAAREVTHA